jgi:hypothetical protein
VRCHVVSAHVHQTLLESAPCDRLPNIRVERINLVASVRKFISILILNHAKRLEAFIVALRINDCEDGEPVDVGIG